MAEVLCVDLNGVDEKWHKLLLTLANQPEPVIRCCFADARTAREASTKMCAAVKSRPGWFNLMVARRGLDVYVVKLGKIKKVVVKV